MQSDPNPSSSLPKIIGIIVAILVCCSCIAIVAAGAFFYRAYQSTPFSLTPFVPFGSTVTPEPTVQINRPPVNSISTETLDTLEQALVPENNPSQLACQLKGACNIPATMESPVVPHAVGDKQNFWVSNLDTNGNLQVDATLKYVTPHVYFWVEDGVSYDETDLKNLADAFENKIYPIDREFFGSEWSPGIDGDVHIYILYARGLGNSVAGYFSSADEVPPLAHPYSNAHEMFNFNADITNLGED